MRADFPAAAWDFNFDGQTFHADADGLRVTPTFTEAGDRTVVAQVRDNAGQTVDVSLTVTVHGPPPGTMYCTWWVSP